MVNQPDSVGRATENEPGPVHLARADRQQHRFAMPPTNLHRDLCLRRQVNVMPLHFLQTILADALEEAGGRAVVQNLRWDLW